MSFSNRYCSRHYAGATVKPSFRMVVFFLVICLVASLSGCGDQTDHTGEAKIPLAPSMMEGKDYTEVLEKFEESGFTNVSTEQIDDLITGWLTHEGEVEEVLIDGSADFSSGDWIPADTAILVRYHVFEKDEPDDNSTLPPSETTAPDTEGPAGEQGSAGEDKETPPPAPSDDTEGQATLPENSTFEIHFIDVGQADSALVLCDGEAMLIDGGNAEDSNLIYSYLKKLSQDHLDYIVCTHGHEDHVGGLAGALNYASVDHALCSVTSYDSKAFGNFTKYLDKQGVSIEVPSAGDTFRLGSAQVQVLGPINSSNEPNNMSIVLRIVYGETSFLFTGDAEREEEQDILDAGYSLDSTVLKVGHHGSANSTTYPFLREVMPEYAVISVGKDNSYGHPTEEALSRLRDADVTVYRTDMQGDIICTSDGKVVSFSVERNADADTLASIGPNSTQQGTSPATPPPQDDEQQDTPAPAGAQYVLNTNTHKFHYPSCSSVKQMSEKNKSYYTGTRDEVIDMGYEPCQRCNP